MTCTATTAEPMGPTRAATSATGSPWWERLPDDFRGHGHGRGGGSGGRDGNDGSNSDAVRPRLLVASVAALERVARVPLAIMVAAATQRSLAAQGGAAHELEALRFYEPLARAGDAARVFMPPRKGIAIEERALPSIGSGSTEIKRRELRFASPFTALNPAAAAGIARMERSAVAHAEHWCHGDRPRPTLIVAHGFAFDAPWLNAHALGLRALYRAGYDILLSTFPHHGPRAELNLPFNGYGVFGSELLHFNEVTLLAIHDLRVFIDHLKSRGVERIGITGISLGGYTAALLASVDERLAYCMPVVPAVTPIDAFLEWQPTGIMLAALMRRHGIGVAEMRALVAIHNPLTYASPMAGERVLIIAGAGDRVTGPNHVQLLQRHWPGSTLHWFPGNHLLHFGRRNYLRLMREHIDRWSRP
ncbi:MAG: alpha/beta hydrolase family protein [Rubrivivax sp.]